GPARRPRPGPPWPCRGRPRPRQRRLGARGRGAPADPRCGTFRPSCLRDTSSTGPRASRTGSCDQLDPLPCSEHKPADAVELRAVRGVNDILPEEVTRWQRLEGAFRTHAELHGYAEVRTPLIEHTTLFARQIGETTDVVEKEMYSFDRHGDALTVRP